MTATDLTAPQRPAGVELETLEAKGLIRLASIQPELEYLFRHALVQDAAYGSLLKQERRGLHAQVGEAIEALYPDRRGELAAVLAMHFEQAGEVDKAIDYLVAAGSYALQRNALHEAYDAFDKADTLLAQAPSEDEVTARRRVEVRLGRIEAGYSFRPSEEMFEELEQIVPEVEALGDDQLLIKTHMLIALGRLQTGDNPEDPFVERSLARIAEIGEATGDRSLRALPLALVGMNNVFAGSVRTGIAQLEEALPLLDDKHDSIGTAFARGALGVGYGFLGEFEKADAASAWATEVAARGDIIAQLDALIMASIIESQKGHLEAAIPIAQECVDRAEATGASACILASSWVLGDALHKLGRFADARDVLKRGAEVSRIVDRKVWRPTLQAWLQSAAAALGEREGDIDEGLAMARAIGNPLGEAGILAKRAEIAASGGDVAGAIADLEASAAIAEREGARPSLARILQGLGGALRSLGRHDEADAALRRSLALFEELGITAEADAVRAALALRGTTLAFD
jgi:tetratricopeptide (TPR) repeat protein